MNTLALGPSWLDPDFLISEFGLIGVLLIVFAESGLFFGFFLPGDSLLFTTGLLVTTGVLKTPLWLTCTLIVIAAIVGDQVGYLFGRKVGPKIFTRPDSRFFKQENVHKAHEFFEKHGAKSLVLARFVPVVRTFTPIVAGVSRMNYRTFITFNVIGGVVWGAGVTLLGAALGNVDFVHANIELILVGIVLLSIMPIVIEYLRARGKSKKEAAAAGSAGAGPETGPTDMPAAPGAMGAPGAPGPAGPAPAPAGPGAPPMNGPVHGPVHDPMNGGPTGAPGAPGMPGGAPGAPGDPSAPGPGGGVADASAAAPARPQRRRHAKK